MIINIYLLLSSSLIFLHTTTILTKAAPSSIGVVSKPSIARYSQTIAQSSRASAAGCVLSSVSIPWRRTRRTDTSNIPWNVRGGDAEEDEDECNVYDVEDEDDEGEASIGSSSHSITSTSMLWKVMDNISTLVGTIASGLQRAVVAGISNSDENDEEDEGSDYKTRTLLSKIIRTTSRMWNAAINTSPILTKTSKPSSEESRSSTTEENLSEEATASDERKHGSTSSSRTVDFGTYLAKTYLKNNNASSSSTTPILGGSLSDALRTCRSKAHLLLVFLPSAKAKSNENISAIQSLLDYDMIEKALTYKQKQKESASTTNSCYSIWSAKGGSSEATKAMKRLQAVVPKNRKLPILLVAYPAQAIDKYTGNAKLQPRMLSQHHCNPPPNSSSLAKWLVALRKRHAKQISKMRIELKELQLYRERVLGYRESQVGDIQREQDTLREMEELKLKQEEEEQARIAREERRQELLESLPAEPPNTGEANVITIALRFANGSRGQRRFPMALETEEQTEMLQMGVVFNWIEGEFGIERETLELAMMKAGDGRSFEYERDGSLELNGLGLGKMCGLRVMELKKEDDMVQEDDTENKNVTQETKE